MHRLAWLLPRNHQIDSIAEAPSEPLLNFPFKCMMIARERGAAESNDLNGMHISSGLFPVIALQCSIALATTLLTHKLIKAIV